MSASREKQNRKAVGAPPKTAREAQMRKEEQRSRLMYGAIGVALVVAIIASILWNSNIIARSATAATVDGRNYSAAQVSFYYRNAYMTFANQWSGLLSYFGLDTSTPLESQEINDTAAGFLDVEAGTNWKEYFLNRGLEQIATVQNTLEQAREENFTWPESVQEELDEAMENLSSVARGNGVTNGRYLQSIFGAVMTERVYRAELLRLLQSQAYNEAYEDRISYTEDELAAAYDASPNDYDFVNYESVKFDGTFVEPEEDADAVTDLDADENHDENADAEEADDENTDEDADAVTGLDADENHDENADAEEAVSENTDEDADAVTGLDADENHDENADAEEADAEEADDENTDEDADAVTDLDADENHDESADENETETGGVVEADRSNSGANQSDEETTAVPADDADADEENADAEEADDENTDEDADAVTDSNADENHDENAEEADAEEVQDNPYRDKAIEQAEAMLARLRRHNGNDLEAISEDVSDADYSANEKANYENTGYTSNVLADWLFDEDREAGDTDMLEDGDIFYVVVFHERFRDEEKTVKIRHILITPEDVEDEETADDEELTEEEQAERDAAREAAEEAAKETAKEKAEEIYQEWKDGDATEESFAALAKEYTDDSNGDQGGLYERVYEGQMVAEFNDWCFDPDRKPGDTDIVETTYGYHVMYYVGDDLPRWEAQVFDDLKSEDYNNWVESLSADAVITRHDFGMRFV